MTRFGYWRAKRNTRRDFVKDDSGLLVRIDFFEGSHPDARVPIIYPAPPSSARDLAYVAEWTEALRDQMNFYDPPHGDKP